MPTVTNSPTPPVAPAEGDLWFNTITGRTFDWYIGPSGAGTWVEVEPTGPTVTPVVTPPLPPPATRTATPFDTTRTPQITVAQLPPSGPLEGDLWFDTFTGREFVWYTDADGSQWVVTQPQFGSDGGGGGGAVHITAGTGIIATPNPITGPGTLTADIPFFDNNYLRTITAGAGITVTGVPPNETVAITNAIAAGGPIGDGNHVAQITWNAQGELTAVASVAITPASIGGVQSVGVGFGILLGGTALNPVLSADTAALAGLYLPLAGGVMTGDISFGDLTAGSPRLRKGGGGGLDVVKADLSNYATLTAATLAVQTSVFFGNFGSIVTPGVDGHLTFFNNAGTAGTRIDFSTDATAKFRNRTNTADASITAFGGTFSGQVTVGTGGLFVGAGSIALNGVANGDIVTRSSGRIGFGSGASGNVVPDIYFGRVAVGVLGFFADATHGVSADVTVDGTIKLRNRANSADANVTFATQAPGTNNNLGATTAFVMAALASGTTISVGTAPPGSPQPNQLWWKSDDGVLYIYYNDGTSTQWVPTSPATSTSGMLGSAFTTDNTLRLIDASLPIIPTDDTIPQITEGFQIMSVTYTPKSASSKLRIRSQVVGICSSSTSGMLTIFRDAGPNAIAASISNTQAASWGVNLYIEREVATGSTAPTTITARVGVGASGQGFWMNGSGGARLFGGVSAATLSVEEYI